jgi:D-alanine-D-alanine ligase
VDVRLADDGTPYVLEVNPLPGLDPDESNYPMMARAAGLEYPALLERLVRLTAARAAVVSHPASIEPAPAEAIAGGMAAL